MKTRQEVEPALRLLQEFTQTFGSGVAKLAEDKLLEWRALMEFQLGAAWWEPRG